MVYDWHGPKLPIVNNRKDPDFIFKKSLDNETTFPLYGHYPGPSLSLFPEIDIIPSFALKDNDTFIYNITNPESNGISGIFENSNNTGFFNSDLDILKETLITESILDRIRKGNGYLMFEITGESYISDKNIERLHSYFEQYKIPLYKIIYYIGSVNGKELYIDYCKRNDIRYRMNVTIYEWFEYIAGIQINDSSHLLQPKDYSKIEKTFLCYNSRWRPHRASLYAIFYKLDLLKYSYYSMADQPEYLSWAHYWYSPHNLRLSGEEIAERLSISPMDITELNNMVPLQIDNIGNTNDKTLLILPEISDLHHKTLISVITETKFHTNDIFFTEKTYKPIGNKHPFIMVGPYKSLYYLRLKGYKTFSDFFDESYDLEENPTERLLKIGSLCKYINSWSEDQKKSFYTETQSITEHNYKLLKSVEFKNTLNLGYK